MSPRGGRQPCKKGRKALSKGSRSRGHETCRTGNTAAGVVLLSVVKVETTTTLLDSRRLAVRPPRDFNVLKILKFLYTRYQSSMSETHR